MWIKVVVPVQVCASWGYCHLQLVILPSAREFYLDNRSSRQKCTPPANSPTLAVYVDILEYKPEELRKESVFLCCFCYGWSNSRKSGWTVGVMFQSTAVRLSKASRVQNHFIFLSCKKLLDTEVSAWVNPGIGLLDIDKKWKLQDTRLQSRCLRQDSMEIGKYGQKPDD